MLQNNLLDDVAHCDKNTDRRPIEQLIECFDNRLLILEQVSDGVGDCCDMFDECLCDTYFDTEICTNMFKEKYFQGFDNENQIRGTIF